MSKRCDDNFYDENFVVAKLAMFARYNLGAALDEELKRNIFIGFEVPFDSIQSHPNVP